MNVRERRFRIGRVVNGMSQGLHRVALHVIVFVDEAISKALLCASAISPMYV